MKKYEEVFDQVERPFAWLDYDAFDCNIAFVNEACENTEEKIVKFKFAIEDGKIILSVKNTYDRKPNEVSGELLTTKLDKMEEHGIGLKNVKEVVVMNKGIDVIDFDEKWFSVSIIIPV